ncbi:hypothetical protein FPSE_07758, partial [Fusarium pseudograminearum CS3096]
IYFLKGISIKGFKAVKPNIHNKLY